MQDIHAHDHHRSPLRAARLRAALDRARADAASSPPLTFARLASWQRHVLGTPGTPPFRTFPAYAKQGRERYGTGPDLPDHLDSCLAQSADPALPLAARAARAYLDVCFFHPFDDGNARSAFLALTFVLARASVALDEVTPIRRVPRRADDPEGALSFADLVAVLITATARRATSHESTASLPPHRHSNHTVLPPCTRGPTPHLSTTASNSTSPRPRSASGSDRSRTTGS
ncbi:Fic family protein [Streptomyces ipomoeae]|uniref:Fido domain-containing protein n=1 Tax=Streptomyces ipomoeae 91-03 TaxID=698759 RepID=L1L5Y3_9ACTN|nr:hypothetical protein STRIP9103_02660 [Streptomyces ipomoeae 91-03]